MASSCQFNEVASHDRKHNLAQVLKITSTLMHSGRLACQRWSGSFRFLEMMQPPAADMNYCPEFLRGVWWMKDPWILLVQHLDVTRCNSAS